MTLELTKDEVEHIVDLLIWQTSKMFDRKSMELLHKINQILYKNRRGGMSRCKTCGDESYGRRVCSDCLHKWTERRKVAFDQAVKEIGPLTKDTQKSIVKRIKQLEREGQE